MQSQLNVLNTEIPLPGWEEPWRKWQHFSPKPRYPSTRPNKKVRELILEELFITNLYQLDKESTKFTIWKYWKSCVKKLDGNDPNFLPATHGACITTMHPACAALSVRKFLATKQITVLEHPAYSPDLAPNDFFLFPTIKVNWKEHILMTLITSGVKRRQLWRPFHKTSSKIVLKGGSGAGIGA